MPLAFKFQFQIHQTRIQIALQNASWLLTRIVKDFELNSESPDPEKYADRMIDPQILLKSPLLILITMLIKQTFKNNGQIHQKSIKKAS